MPTLHEIGEHAAIALLTAGLHHTGDDCAVVPIENSPCDLVLTTDPLIEGIHFEPSTPPEQIGWKAAARVLSDLAAMGAEPRYLLINLVCPPATEIDRLQQIYKGVDSLLSRFETDLAGGDLAQGPVLELHVFGVGRVPAGTALLRSGARPGDLIFVTGPLGNSYASGTHLTFLPKVDEGRALRECGLVHAMMDISDGLATDLRHLLRASNCGADLHSASIPKNGTLAQALFDGEDFELLLTVGADSSEAFDRFCRQQFGRTLPRIGLCTNQTGILTVDHTVLEGKAFEHFKN